MPRADQPRSIEAALLYARLLFPDDRTTNTDTEETTVSEDTTHHFAVTVTGCDAEQAARVMGERLLHDEDYGFGYRVDYQKAPTHAAVCIVDDGPAEIVLCTDAASAKEMAERMALLEVAGTNWAEEHAEDFQPADIEATAYTGTAADVASLLSDASNEGAFDREQISWGPGRIVDPVPTVGPVTVPVVGTALVEKLIAAGTLSPAARTERAATVLTQLLEANATNRVRAKLGTALTIACTAHEHEGQWWLQVPFGAPGSALLLATDATDRADTDALGWNVSLTDLELLEPDASDED